MDTTEVVGMLTKMRELLERRNGRGGDPLNAPIEDALRAATRCMSDAAQRGEDAHLKYKMKKKEARQLSARCQEAEERARVAEAECQALREEKEQLRSLYQEQADQELRRLRALAAQHGEMLQADSAQRRAVLDAAIKAADARARGVDMALARLRDEMRIVSLRLDAAAISAQTLGERLGRRLSDLAAEVDDGLRRILIETQVASERLRDVPTSEQINGGLSELMAQTHLVSERLRDAATSEQLQRCRAELAETLATTRDVAALGSLQVQTTAAIRGDLESRAGDAASAARLVLAGQQGQAEQVRAVGRDVVRLLATRLATKRDVSLLATKSDIEPLATKVALQQLATKNGLREGLCEVQSSISAAEQAVVDVGHVVDDRAVASAEQVVAVRRLVDDKWAVVDETIRETAKSVEQGLETQLSRVMDYLWSVDRSVRKLPTDDGLRAATVELARQDDLRELQQRLAGSVRDLQQRLAGKDNLLELQQRFAGSVRELHQQLASRDDLRELHQQLASRDDLRELRQQLASKDNLRELASGLLGKSDDLAASLASLRAWTRDAGAQLVAALTAHAEDVAQVQNEAYLPLAEGLSSTLSGLVDEMDRLSSATERAASKDDVARAAPSLDNVGVRMSRLEQTVLQLAQRCRAQTPPAAASSAASSPAAASSAASSPAAASSVASFSAVSSAPSGRDSQPLSLFWKNSLEDFLNTLQAINVQGASGVGGADLMVGLLELFKDADQASFARWYAWQGPLGVWNCLQYVVEWRNWYEEERVSADHCPFHREGGCLQAMVVDERGHRGMFFRQTKRA